MFANAHYLCTEFTKEPPQRYEKGGEIIEFSRLNDMVQILVTADTLDELTEAYWADERNIKWFDGFKDWVIYHLCGFCGQTESEAEDTYEKICDAAPSDYS